MSNKRSKNTHAPTDVQTGRCTHTRACMHSDAIMMDSDLGTQEYLKAALKEMERRKARQINKVLLFIFFFFFKSAMALSPISTAEAWEAKLEHVGGPIYWPRWP